MFRMKLIVGFLAFFSVVCVYLGHPTQGAELDPVKQQLIDQLVNSLFIPANNVTGMILSVVVDGDIVLSKGYAKQDIENDIDATNNTLFAIGSITKSFISTLVVKTLSERFSMYGEYALDAPIVELNPNFNFTFSDRFRAEQLSFRDLLSHRHCLFDQGIDLTFKSVKTKPDYNYRTRYHTQACGIRDGGFTYNNALYALAGELIASIEGKTIDEMVKDFFTELEMTSSTIIESSYSYEDLPNMSQAYFQRDGQIHKFNNTLLRRLDIGFGAGGILSTATDMAKYANFHLNKGMVGDKQVVSSEALSWMYKTALNLPFILPRESETGPSASGAYGYGLGLMLGLYNGYTFYGHGGYWPPFQSEFFVFPAKNIGIFLSTNGPGSVPDPMFTHTFVGMSIFEIITTGNLKTKITKDSINPIPGYTNLDVEFGLSNFKSVKVNADNNKTPKVEFEDAIGFYGDAVAGDFEVTLDEEDESFLQMNLGEFGVGRLVPVSGSETKFSIIWKTDIMHHFYTYPEAAPSFVVEFLPDEVALWMNDIIVVVFIKNAFLETFPVIPWDPTSCGPQ